MTSTRMILISEDDLKKYREKLDFVQGYRIPHVNDPDRYPCLAVTEFCDDLVSPPQWEHLYVYSLQLEDLEVIYHNLDDVAAKQIVKAQKITDKKSGDWRLTIRDAQPEKEMGPEKSDWEKFWESAGDVSEEPDVAGAREVRQQEWEEYEATRTAIIGLAKTDFSAAVKRCKVYFDRWPKSSYRELLLFQIKALARRSDPAPIQPQAATSDTTHDFYPYNQYQDAAGQDQEVAESKSRHSRRTAPKEVNFVDEA